MIKVKKIDTALTEIDKIFHISDVHIRNLKRHIEYSEVFERIYTYIRKNRTENSVIFLGGDIVHAKTDMTPELVDMTQKFLKSCADLCYTILITGNHDLNLNNKNRLDALSPIVKAINHDKLIYLKDGGVYHIADIHFTVMGVTQRPDEFIRASQFDAPYKIALHHGAVDTSVTDTGHVLSNKHVTTAMFAGYDLTLLGDIHVPAQYLNKEKTIAYPGSTIQQNYAEAKDHGLLVWDVKSKTSNFVVIPNDYCYYTLDVENGQYILPDTLPKNLRLRLRVINTSAADIKPILADAKSKYNVLETPVQKVANFSPTGVLSSKISLGDVRDIEFQNQLISEYLKSTLNTTDDIIDGVKHVNRTCNTLLQKLEVSRNTVWIPKMFTFSNMFSYGENNVIDFTKLKGLYGLFAPNAAGKSTLFEALSFCIFDKCNRTSRAEHVLNNRSTEFFGKFEFDIGDKSYVIERTGQQRKDHVRVIVNFYTISESGEMQSLNGKERSDTNKIIRTYLGTYEDFVLTSYSVQNNNTGFIDMGQRERKELLAQFLDSDIFEHLYKVANEESKELASVIKDLNKQNLDTKLADTLKLLGKSSLQLETAKQQKESKESEIHSIFELISLLSGELVPLSINNSDLDELTVQRTNIEYAIRKDVDSRTSVENKLLLLQKGLVTNRTQLSSINLEEITAGVAHKHTVQVKLDNLHSALRHLVIDIQHKEQKLAKLDKLEYDENCSYCMNNIFVKDAIETKQSLKVDVNNKLTLQQGILVLETELDMFPDYDSKKLLYASIDSHIKTTESEILRVENEKLRLDSNIDTRLANLQKINDDIRFCEEHSDAIKKNGDTNKLITHNRSLINDLKAELQNIETLLNECLYGHTLNVSKRDHMVQEMARLAQLQKEFNYYQLYMTAFSRDGIPYQLITKALPKIETEVNNILSQVVDYQIHFNSDGKNINAYIVYDTEKFWPLELSSGMEKFVASLAIRTALINISSLPRPPFLVIDEGMGNLDAENLNNMYVLFDYLKTQFEYMVVVSHIDTIRDMVDSLIEIVKVNEKSSIIYD